MAQCLWLLPTTPENPVVFVNNRFQIVLLLSDSTAVKQLRVGQTELFRLRLTTLQHTPPHIYPAECDSWDIQNKILKPHLYVHNECCDSITCMHWIVTVVKKTAQLNFPKNWLQCSFFVTISFATTTPHVRLDALHSRRRALSYFNISWHNSDQGKNTANPFEETPASEDKLCI